MIRKLFIQHPFVGVQYTSEGNVKTAKNPRVAACLSGQLEVTDLHGVLAEHRSTLTGQSIETAQRRRADLKPDRRRSHQRGIYFIPHRPVCVTFCSICTKWPRRRRYDSQAGEPNRRSRRHAYRERTPEYRRFKMAARVFEYPPEYSPLLVLKWRCQV